MLKKAASFVLASLKSSTYRTEYASAFRSLRPCWPAFLNILSISPAGVAGRDDVADGCLVGKQHDEAVDADAFAGGRRHPVFERAQKVFIDQVGFFVTRRVLCGLRFESLALVERIVQLREGVGNLTAGDVELEAIGQRRIGVFRLANGEISDRKSVMNVGCCKFGSTVSSKISLRFMATWPVHLFVQFEVLVVRPLSTPPSGPSVRLVQLVHLQMACMVRPSSPRRREIDLRALILNRRGAEDILREPRAQLFRQDDQVVIVGIGQVKFQHREFRIMNRRDAFVAEIPIDFEDAGKSADDQALEI